MNLILLEEADFIDQGRVRLTGRRLEHIRQVRRYHVRLDLFLDVAWRGARAVFGELFPGVVLILQRDFAAR